MKQAQNSCKESTFFGQFNYLPPSKNHSHQAKEQKEHTVKKVTLGFWTASRPLLLQQMLLFSHSNKNLKDFAFIYFTEKAIKI